MRKIILVSNTSWYLYNFRLSVIRLLQQKNFQVICIANYDEYSEKLKELGVTFIQSSLANKGINPFEDISYACFLWRQYKKYKPCFIFHYTIKPNIYGSLAAKVLKIKSIAIVSGAGYVFLRRNILNRITRRLYKMAAKASTEVWFVNREDEQMFIEEKIVTPAHTKILPGEGINTEIFKRDLPYPAANKDFTFLLAGRMMWYKGVGIYTKAAKIIKQKYPNTRFQLLGFVDASSPSAISKEQINAWESAGIIEYLGATSDIKKFLQQINCFVLPSYYREGVPKSLLEAASLEIPIITTNNVGCREVVKDGYNGFLCAVKDTKDLAEKMEKMITMDKFCLEEMGKKGRKKVIAEFHEKLVLKYYEDVLNNI